MECCVSDEQRAVIDEIFKNMNMNSEPESDADVKTWLQSHSRLGACYSGGNIAGQNEYRVINPSTGDELTTVVLADDGCLIEAVKLARKAFHTWKCDNDKRTKYLSKIAESLEKKDDIFCLLESITTGKPLFRIRSVDFPNLVANFRESANSALSCQELMRDFEPSGIVYVIASSYNYPLMSICWHIADALAVGNSVILDIDVAGYLTASLLEHIVKESGVPEGVFTVLPRLTPLLYEVDISKLEGVNKIFLSGSLEDSNTLRLWNMSANIEIDIQTILCPTAVVCNECDIHSAVEGIVKLFCFNDARTSAAGCTVLAQEGIADSLLKRLYPKLKKLTIGNSLSTPDIVATSNKLKASHKLQGNGTMKELSPGATEFAGRVLTFAPFRTVKEAIAMCNHQKSGCDFSIWCEKIPVALLIAHSIKSSNIWVNCQNVFDNIACYGSVYTSGNVKAGGTLKSYSYVKHVSDLEITYLTDDELPDEESNMKFLSEACKMYIGGSFCYSDNHKSRFLLNAMAKEVGRVPDASPGDINSCVTFGLAALHKWQNKTALDRSKVLRKLAKALSDSEKQFSQILQACVCRSMEDCVAEVRCSVKRLIHWAAKNEKYTGVIKDTQMYGKVLETFEALGIVGIICPDEFPLLSFVSLVAPCIVKGNAVVVLPSEKYPVPALKLCLLLNNCGLPGGIVNVITGCTSKLSQVLVKHMDVESVWVHNNSTEIIENARKFTVTNQKTAWIAQKRNWLNPKSSQNIEFMLRATFCKTVWMPMGDIFAN